MDHSTLTGNSAVSGGGMSVYGATFVAVTNCYFDHNIAYGVAGAGLYIYGTFTPDQTYMMHICNSTALLVPSLLQEMHVTNIHMYIVIA